MFVNTQIYGYSTEDGTLCLGCVKSEDTAVRESQAIHSDADEDPHGLTCDNCGGTIFEPVEAHPSRNCEYSCTDYCGDSERDCLMHYNNHDISLGEDGKDYGPLDVE